MTKLKALLPKSRLALFSLPLLCLCGCGSPEQRSEGYYESGKALVEKKDDYSARREFYKAIKYNANNVEAWKGLAGTDERTEATQDLFRDLRRVVELDSNDLDARLKLARMMAVGGAADAAMKVIEVAKEDPNKPNANLHAVKALILARTKDPAGAVREAQRAFEIDPTNVDAVDIVASKKAADGDLDGALKLLDSLRPDRKDETRIALEKVQLLARKGDFTRAEASMRELVARNPKETAFPAQLIQLLLEERHFDDAEKELRARAEANPSDTKMGFELIRFLNTVKGPDAARAELDARIKAGGDVFDYQIALADIEIAQGKSDDAFKLLQTLIESANSAERKVSAQVKLAALDIAKSNIAAADAIITQVLTADRRNAVALRLRATIKLDRGQVDEAVSDLREALNAQPNSPELSTLLATAYERGGKSELADRQYADALKSSGQNPAVALQYVAFLQRQGDLARAEDVLTDAATRFPNNVQIISSLAQVRMARKNWAGALNIADTLAKSEANRGIADQIRAAALAGQNKIDESISALEDARKAAPDAVQPVVSLASTYVRHGEPDKAVALLEDLKKKFPANAQLLVLLGNVKLSQKKDDEALKEFKEAVAKQPKDPIGYGALSDLYIRQKNFDAAGNVIQAALTEQPGNLNFRLSSAGLNILKGDSSGAIAQYEAILKDQPDQVVAINNLVSLLLDNRSDKESIDRAFSMADRLKATNVPQFQDTLGWAQYKHGDYKSAVTTLTGAVAKLPDLAAAHYHLGLAYKAAGQPEKAAEQLKAALGLEPDGSSLKESIRAALQ